MNVNELTERFFEIRDSLAQYRKAAKRQHPKRREEIDAWYYAQDHFLCRAYDIDRLGKLQATSEDVGEASVAAAHERTRSHLLSTIDGDRQSAQGAFDAVKDIEAPNAVDLW